MGVSSGASDGKGLDSLEALSQCRVISLSHPLSPEMPHWPGDPPTQFETWSDLGRAGYFLRRFTLGEHSGTHLTAPASYYSGGRTVDQYSADELVHPVVVIDVVEHCGGDPDYALTVDALLAWEERHARVPPGTLVFLRTGWSERWPDSGKYLGPDRNGGLHFPGFGYEAAALLVSERGVTGLGTDTAGIEPGADTELSVSRLVLAQPRIVLENLTNLDQLPATGAVVVIGLLRLVGGSGSPAAVTAFAPLANS